MKVHAVTAAEI